MIFWIGQLEDIDGYLDTFFFGLSKDEVVNELYKEITWINAAYELCNDLTEHPTIKQKEELISEICLDQNLLFVIRTEELGSTKKESELEKI